MQGAHAAAAADIAAAQGAQAAAAVAAGAGADGHQSPAGSWQARAAAAAVVGRAARTVPAARPWQLVDGRVAACLAQPCSHLHACKLPVCSFRHLPACTSRCATHA